MNYEAWRISYQDSEQAARAAYQSMTHAHIELSHVDRILCERLARCVRAEVLLLEVAAGKRPMLTTEECRTLALFLGTPHAAQTATQQAMLSGIEIIRWVTDGGLPDADELVLVEGPDPGDVWSGCYDGEQWLTQDGMPVDVRVLAWAEWPAGSKGGAV